MNWYLECFRKYATFSGRARRSEYWYFILFNFLAALIFGFLDGAFFNQAAQMGLGPLSGVYSLVAFLPSWAVTVRRMHDTNRSGWVPFWLTVGPGIASTFAGFGVIAAILEASQGGYVDYEAFGGQLVFLGLIWLVVGIVWLVFLVQDSQPGDNAYGPYPK